MSFYNQALFSTNTQSLVTPGQGHGPTQHVGTSGIDIGYNYDGLAHLPFQQFTINMPSTETMTVPNPFSIPNMSALLNEARIRLGKQCLTCSIEVPLPILAPTAWKTIALHKLVPSLTTYFKMSAQTHGRKDNFYFCPDCCHYSSLTGTGMNRVNQFLMSLTELEGSIQELKVIIQTQLQCRPPQTRPQNVAAGTGTENLEPLLNKGLELPSSFDRYVTENVFGDHGTTPLSLDSPPAPDRESDSDWNEVEESAPEPESKNSALRLKTWRAKPALRGKEKTCSQNRPKRLKSNLDEEPSSPFVCETCGTLFKKDHQLASHMLLHTGEKPFECKECGKRFRHNPALFLHMKLHAGDRQYKCETCGHGFVTKWKLKNHLRTHTLEKPFQCSHCGKAFTIKTSLDSHVARLHPEHAVERFRPENRFKCASCPKSYLRIGQLRLHEVNSHRVQDRQIVCEVCGKKFGHNISYRRHMSTVHMGIRRPVGPPKHMCPECGKLLRTPSDLKKHVETHVPKQKRKKKHTCDVCYRVFVTEKCFIAHQKGHELGNPVVQEKKVGRSKSSAASLVKECRTNALSIRLRRMSKRSALKEDDIVAVAGFDMESTSDEQAEELPEIKEEALSLHGGSQDSFESVSVSSESNVYPVKDEASTGSESED